jgi:hypothetical protein
VTVTRRKQAPRTSMEQKKAAIDAALDVVTGLTHEGEPQTAEEARNYVSPHDRLAAALQAAIASHDHVRGPSGDSEHYPAIEAACEQQGVSLQRPITKASKIAVRALIESMNLPPTLSVDAFVKWLRRSAAK